MMQGIPRTIINVISGKGGTGKTLVASVLAEMLGNAPGATVVIVDLDVFVRGLTSLLYFHQEEKLRIAGEGELTVADFFVRKIRQMASGQGLAIVKYRSFHVVPAVARIDEVLNFQDIVPNNRDEARQILGNLISQIPTQYRFVILDSRAGYDELISATHEVSDVSICVEEEDPISRVTAENLVAQLQKDSDTPLFRLINKARGITSEQQLEGTRRSVTDLGVIPFDMDVLNSFGSKNFWEEIAHSMYRVALAKAWNRLASKLQLGVELRAPRMSPLVSERLEARVGILRWKDRVLLIYGLLLAIFGLGYAILGREILMMLNEDPFRLFSLFVGAAGLMMTILVFLRSQRR